MQCLQPTQCSTEGMTKVPAISPPMLVVEPSERFPEPVPLAEALVSATAASLARQGKIHAYLIFIKREINIYPGLHRQDRAIDGHLYGQQCAVDLNRVPAPIKKPGYRCTKRPLLHFVTFRVNTTLRDTYLTPTCMHVH